MRKPVRSPRNTLKKKPSIIPGETANRNEQPWTVAHLRITYCDAPVSKNATMTSRKSVDNTLPQKEEQPNDSEAAVTPLLRRQLYIDPIAGHSNVTIPARPTRKYTYSECFDLDDLAPGTQVRSPSGNMLSAEQAAVRADRPVGIKERQEAIRRRVAEQRQKGLGNEVTVVGDSKTKEKREKERKKQREGEAAKRARMKGKSRAWSKCRCQ